jgi:hypothetical protein
LRHGPSAPVKDDRKITFTGIWSPVIIFPSSLIPHPCFLPGAARVLVTFSCAAKEKVTKEKAAQVRRS